MQTALKPQTEETIDTDSKVLLTRVPLKLGKLRILGIQASRDVTSLKLDLQQLFELKDKQVWINRASATDSLQNL